MHFFAIKTSIGFIYPPIYILNKHRIIYSKIMRYICHMKEKRLEISYQIYAFDELNVEDKRLINAAMEATRRSYAPYSHFHVGAAALLENDMIVTGSNQENVAYPSGLCAERTTLFYANSQYPDIAIKALAIAACDKNGTPSANIISPCGACRQVMLETENRFGKPIKILLYGYKEVYVIESAASLLPLAFSDLS